MPSAAGRLSLAAARATGPSTSARTVLSLLWRTSRPLSAGVALWVAAESLLPALVVAAFGVVVAHVPAALQHGLGSHDGHALVGTLVVAALIYALSLVTDPAGSALGTAVNARITGDLQKRLLTAVGSPVGVGHLEDSGVLDRLALAEGSLTGFFPGDAPVTWAGVLSGRVSGIVGCAVVAGYFWWMGLGLLLLWVLVRRDMLKGVVHQATKLRTQSTEMRRAWWFTGLGSKVGDAKEVRVFGLADFVAGRYRHHYAGTIAAGAPALRRLHVRAALSLVAVVAAYVACLVVIALRARDGELSLRSLVILLPMLAVTSSTGSVGFDDITLAWTLAGLPDVDSLERDLLGSTAALAGSGAVSLTRELRLESVVFRYPGSDRDVLTGVDLTLPVGTSTAIVGVNGAGKSTLVSLLARLRDPTGGRITADGTDTRDLDPAAWQRLFALVPQQPVHYPVSAYDNIAFGAVEFRDDADGVRAAAAQAGFAIDDWDVVLSRELGGTDLSGGQWQRLALARALFATRHGARILVLDEPTAALDIQSEALFYQRFLEITAGLTSVVISHRFATVRRADAIAVLDGGVVTERGTHDELVALGGAYASLFEKQAARFR